MNPYDRLWEEEDDAYLRCPIPAPYLHLGALPHRTTESIRWRRRKLGIYLGGGIGNAFVPVGPDVVGRTPAKTCADFPDVDWDQPLHALQEATGMCQRKVWELRKQAIEQGLIGRTFRDGRRPLSREDFPGVDWEQSIAQIMRDTKLSRPTATRLKRDHGNTQKK